MKNLLGILICVLPFTMLAQEPSQCSGSYDSNNQQQGLWTCNYSSGQLWFEINYNAGKLNGVKKEYYDATNSQLKVEATYSNGLLSGSSKEYYSNGQLKYEGNFSNNDPVGIHKEYNEDGTVKSENNFGN